MNMQAKRSLAIAEHLLTTSYPALQDPKILISVLTNIQAGINQAITEALQKAREQKDIPAYSDTYNGKLNAFRMHLAKQYNISKVDLMMITEIHETLLQAKQAPTTFRRKQEFIIADQDFNLTALTQEKAHTYLRRAKTLIKKF